MKHECYQKQEGGASTNKSTGQDSLQVLAVAPSQMSLQEMFLHDHMPVAWQGELQAPATDYTDGSLVPRDTEPQRQSKKMASAGSPRVWHTFNSREGKLVSLHNLTNNCIACKTPKPLLPH